MRHPGPGIPLYADGELAVYERRVVGADGRHWTITALTRATVEQSVGPALHFYGGWALSTAGALLAWLGSGQLATAAGLVLMGLGGWAVRHHHARSVATLWLVSGGQAAQRRALACRSAALGDDVGGLHRAQQAVMLAVAWLWQAPGAPPAIPPPVAPAPRQAMPQSEAAVSQDDVYNRFMQ